jgi:hypothetical protein
MIPRTTTLRHRADRRTARAGRGPSGAPPAEGRAANRLRAVLNAIRYIRRTNTSGGGYPATSRRGVLSTPGITDCGAKAAGAASTRRCGSRSASGPVTTPARALRPPTVSRARPRRRGGPRRSRTARRSRVEPGHDPGEDDPSHAATDRATPSAAQPTVSLCCVRLFAQAVRKGKRNDDYRTHY